MTEVISVKFKADGTGYFFDPAGKTYQKGEAVIVETAQGTECATVSESNHRVEDDQIVKPLKQVVRSATPADLKRVAENQERAKKAFPMCEEKIRKHGLDMKLIEVECSFDGSKMIFFFTSDGRVDFRDLVKDLAATFHTRIELRQIGVRDEARMLGGIGICGQPFCCSRFLNEFHPVSIKMAKEQGLSLNPTKISGCCGRLMCCLKYEQDSYEQLLKITPNIGATVKSSEGVGVVTDVNIITGKLSVRLGDGEGLPFKTTREEVTILSRSKPKKQNNPPAHPEKEGEAAPKKKNFSGEKGKNRRKNGENSGK